MGWVKSRDHLFCKICYMVLLNAARIDQASKIDKSWAILVECLGTNGSAKVWWVGRGGSWSRGGAHDEPLRALCTLEFADLGWFCREQQAKGIGVALMFVSQAYDMEIDIVWGAFWPFRTLLRPDLRNSGAIKGGAAWAGGQLSRH